MISMTSRDPLVLTKAISHIEPDRIITFLTLEASKWIESVEKVIKYYLEYKKFENNVAKLVELGQKNDKELVQKIYEGIKGFLKDSEKNIELFCPITLGTAFHKIALPEILSVVSHELDIPFKLVHINADDVSIIQGKGLEVTSTHEDIKPPYFIINDIRKRFSIYGDLSFKKSPILVWKKNETSLFEVKVEAYKKLREAFFQNPDIRREMNGYIDDAKNAIKDTVQAKHISLKNEIKKAIQIASQNLGKELAVDAQKVESAFTLGFFKVLHQFCEKNYNIKYWVEEIKISGIDEMFKIYNSSYKVGLNKSIYKFRFSNPVKGKRKSDFELKLDKSIKKFINNIKSCLIDTFIKAVHAAGLEDKVDSIVSGSIKTEQLDFTLKEIQRNATGKQKNFSSKISDLFEEMLCCELYEYQRCGEKKSDKVHAIYHGVELDLGKKNSDKRSNAMELDALVLKKTGNLLNFEAKTHISSAPRKDMFSRIKNVKDYGGAKAKTYLVFPLLRKDIDKIKEWKPGLEFEFCTKPDRWKNYINETETESDINVIGFDEIKLEMDKI